MNKNLEVMTRNSICGYFVLRKPIYNFDLKEREFFRKEPPCIGCICYSGISRMPWFDLDDDEDYYSGTLPRESIELRNEIDEQYRDFSNIELLRDLDKTKRILAFSNRHQDRNEICVAFSETLAKQKGTFISDSAIQWLGVDVFFSGYGSILEQGIFAKPDLFPEFIIRLNMNGLFDLGSDFVSSYIDEYIEVSEAHNLEPYSGPIKTDNNLRWCPS
ncbi:hypothetical protein [Methylovulum psychrotolerans]|uniref:Uncharacterized protein n=1 Tax=Methylovulum psychrotolerans TaxID=1704499 RepID=A0A2S5CFL5_9GAMM|nr:hypothetical protein [Methylovulum psychrotolerans]POZ49557.1 hypothetical protein AADEFJLK_04677 [Methylovulum psychrotolerans]